MSAIRLGRLADGTRDVRIVDNGAVGHITHAPYGLRGGPIVTGNLVTAKSHYDLKRESQRTYKARLRG